MLSFEDDLHFIQRVTCNPSPVNSTGQESALHDYLGLCYYRLNETVTCILQLSRSLLRWSQTYYGMCLLIRPALIDILSIQFMMSSLSVNGSTDEQLVELEKMSSLFINDGVKEIWDQAEIDLQKNVTNAQAVSNLKTTLITHYPNHCSFDANGNFSVKNERAFGAKRLYRNFPLNPHLGNENVIAQMYEQYNLFSKVEHLSKLTPAVLNRTIEQKILEIDKSKFFFLLHLDNILQLFKNVDSNFIEPFKLVRERVENYFEPVS